MDTPIYDELVETYRTRKSIEQFTQSFHERGEKFSQETFDVEEKELEKLKQSLLATLYETVAISQSVIHENFGSQASVFNAGADFVLQIIEPIFDKALRVDEEK